MIDFTVVGELTSSINDKDSLTLCNVQNVYVGVDLTFSSLHLGHMFTFSCAYSLAKKRNVRLVIILGDYTTLVGGDHSNRKVVRVNLSEFEVYENMIGIARQLFKMFPSARLMLNSSWLSKLSLRQVMRLTGQVNVRELLRRSTFKNLIPLTLNQLIYPTLQGYDFWYLSKCHSVNTQVGGKDQLHNILSGMNLMDENSYAFTSPLLEGSDGVKLSKSDLTQFFPWVSRELCGDRNFQFLTSKLISPSMSSKLGVSRESVIKFFCELRGGTYLHKGNHVIEFAGRDLITFLIYILGAKNRGNAKSNLLSGGLKVNQVIPDTRYILKKFDKVTNVKGNRRFLIV